MAGLYATGIGKTKKKNGLLFEGGAPAAGSAEVEGREKRPLAVPSDGIPPLWLDWNASSSGHEVTPESIESVFAGGYS